VHLLLLLLGWKLLLLLFLSNVLSVTHDSPQSIELPDLVLAKPQHMLRLTGKLSQQLKLLLKSSMVT
jgi:hypothetical protein